MNSGMDVFSPFTIGKVKIRNRIFVSAHTTNFAVDFLPTERHVAYHHERAKGGVGLIITEPLRVHETSLGRSGGLGADPAGLPVLARIVDAIRGEGAAAFTQITHAGRHSENVFRRTPAWGPSRIRWSATGSVPHVMTRQDMVEIRHSYVNAARLAVRAGFEGVEIHFGHGHLLHQFISPKSNTREDSYGGTDEARLRYPLEVLDAVLDEVGSEVVVGVRMSSDELVPGGQDLPLGVRMAAELCDTRPIGFLNVSVASYTVPSIGHHVADMSEGHTPYLEQTLAIAKVAGSVPVLTACRVVDLEDAERVLSSGQIAAVAMTRAHIADPHLVRKAMEGRRDEIRPCVSCNFCIGEIGGHRPLTCMMNPAAGREAVWPTIPFPSAQQRSVLVVGGGPAGMEAARVAAERGHQVKLWEVGSELGGQIRTGRRGAGRGELDKLRRYEESMLNKLGVAISTNVEATRDAVISAAPDVLVLATGSTIQPRIVPGWGRALNMEEVLESQSWLGKVVLIIDEEGSWSTSSAAETLARSGAEVHIVAAASVPLWGITEYSRMTAIERLHGLGVQFWMNSSVRFAQGSAHISSSLMMLEKTLPALDDVVAVEAREANSSLSDDAVLRATAMEVHVIGDEAAPRSLLDAMYEGHALGRAL